MCSLSVLIGAWVLAPLPAEGGHGAPPFYTGADADFLKPAGEPHFASLRRFDVLMQLQRSLTGIRNTLNVNALRWVGSTHPEEVLAGHAQALTVGGLSLAANPADDRRQARPLSNSPGP